MKIIVSPSKTKKISNLRGIEIYEEPCFSEITHKIVKELEKMSVSEIEKKFKLKKEQAEKLSKFYKTFETQDYGHALGTCTGIAFKSIDTNSFNKKIWNLHRNIYLFYPHYTGCLLLLQS